MSVSSFGTVELNPFCFMVQKRVDILTKEKEELIKEKQVISKQMEDLRSSIPF